MSEGATGQSPKSIVFARSPEVSSVEGPVKIETSSVFVSGPAGIHAGLDATCVTVARAMLSPGTCSRLLSGPGRFISENATAKRSTS